MELPKSDLVIFVSRPRESAAFRGVLQDWSALGLVRDFVYLEVDSRLILDRAVSVSDGLVEGGRLSAILAARPVTATVQVVCVSQVAGDYSTLGHVAGGHVYQEVSEALPSAEVTWVHAIAVSVPDRWPVVESSDVAWVGAHNVVLTPENSQSPFAGVAPIESLDRLRPLGLTHHVAALCSAAGLWAGDGSQIFNGPAPSGGGQVVALRTFSRHIAADGVRTRLLSRLASTRDGYPIPVTSNGDRLQIVGDETAAIREMVDNLVRLHPEMRVGKRRTAAAPAQREFGLLASFMMFLRFLCNAIKGRSYAGVDLLQRRASARLAGRAQRAFFGDADSRYVVTVNGIRGVKADGFVASATEFDDDLGRLLAQMQGRPGSLPPESHEYPQLWEHFVAGALTLLDGKKRVDELEPPRIGGGVAVVNRSQLIAPDPSNPYLVPSDLQSILRVDVIVPCDSDLARTAVKLAEQRIETEPERSASLHASIESLKMWFGSRRSSYAGAVGGRISVELDKVREEIVGYAAQLVSAQAPVGTTDDLASKQKPLARNLLLHATFFLLGMALTPLLAYWGVISWFMAGVAVVVLLALWAATGTTLFMKRQSEVFRLLEQREHSIQRVSDLKATLEDALVDLRRLQALYRQYLDWSRALGAFVRAPFGTVETVDDKESLLGVGFGHNHRFGAVVPREADIESVSSDLQARLFPVGWLEGPWDEFISDVPEFGDRHLLVADPKLVFTDRPVAEESILAQWSEAVVHAKRVNAAADLNRSLSREMDGPGGASLDRLRRVVRSREQSGGICEMPYLDFVAGLDGVQEGQVAGRNFWRRTFAPVVEGSDPWAVDRAVVTGSRGESGSLIVTELSRPFGPRDLAFGTTASFRSPEPPGLPSQSLPPQV
ncbi:hypothetical protein BH09ACT11_BH09ACT11_06560 [soil metagenome]